MDHENCPMTLKRFEQVERALYQISIIIIITWPILELSYWLVFFPLLTCLVTWIMIEMWFCLGSTLPYGWKKLIRHHLWKLKKGKERKGKHVACLQGSP